MLVGTSRLVPLPPLMTSPVLFVMISFTTSAMHPGADGEVGAA